MTMCSKPCQYSARLSFAQETYVNGTVTIEIGVADSDHDSYMIFVEPGKYLAILDESRDE